MTIAVAPADNTRADTAIFRTSLVTKALYAIATVGEWLGLWFWLSYADARHPWRARACLLAGFTVERVAVAIWIRKFLLVGAKVEKPPIYKTIIGLLATTAAEMLIWHFARLGAAYWDAEIAGLLLLLMIHPLHAAEMAGIRRQPFVKFLVRKETLLFSFIEALGGAVWLGFTHAGLGTTGAGVAAAALLVALFAEHYHQAGELQDSGFQV